LYTSRTERKAVNIRDQFLNSWLKEVKKRVARGEWTFADNNGVSRSKNSVFLEFLRDKGLMPVDFVKETILGLSGKDNPIGPERDIDGYPGYIYKFKIEYIDEDIDEVIYIKIRYNPDPPNEVVCISFHRDWE
jgi:hypothetical protein